MKTLKYLSQASFRNLASGRPPVYWTLVAFNPPLVAPWPLAVRSAAAGGVPHTSFAEFQSGTTPSGHSRAPTTADFTGTVALNTFPRDQMSTGKCTSCVVPLANANRMNMGKGIDVFLLSVT